MSTLISTVTYDVYVLFTCQFYQLTFFLTLSPFSLPSLSPSPSLPPPPLPPSPPPPLTPLPLSPPSFPLLISPSSTPPSLSSSLSYCYPNPILCGGWILYYVAVNAVEIEIMIARLSVYPS